MSAIFTEANGSITSVKAIAGDYPAGQTVGAISLKIGSDPVGFVLVALIVFVLFYFARRFWTRVSKNKPKKTTDMVDNPEFYRICAIIAIFAVFFVFCLTIYNSIVLLLNR